MTFQTPENPEVLQDDTVNPSVPVDIKYPVQINESPTVISAPRALILPVGSRAIMLVPENPRRKRILVFQDSCLDISELAQLCIAATEAECNSFAGAIEEITGGIGQLEFSTTGQLWVRPCVIAQTNGIYEGIGPTVLTDAVLTVVTEDWSH